MGTPEKRTQADVAADRKKQILQAAVEVFAERGFHRTRVSDIAKRAGVAYGLIYHYFDSKDAVLNAVFESNWSVFTKVLQDLRDNPDLTASEKLSSVAALLIDALEVAPSIIQVIIQEISRSDRFVQSEKMSLFNDAFDVVHQMIRDGQAKGELEASLDPLVGAYVFFGALETVCTGFMLGAISCATKEEAEQVKRTVNTIMLSGMKK